MFCTRQETYAKLTSVADPDGVSGFQGNGVNKHPNKQSVYIDDQFGSYPTGKVGL